MRIFAGILVLLAIFSRSENDQKKNILPEKEMKEIMWDMMRADQYVAAFLLKDSTHNKKDQSIELYEQIFHIHKITREQFKTALITIAPDLICFALLSIPWAKEELNHLIFVPVTRVRQDQW
jgi:hypothetical protein